MLKIAPFDYSYEKPDFHDEITLNPQEVLWMMKFAVNLESVYPDLLIVQAMREIKRLGFDAYAIWGWWDKDLQAMRAASQLYQLTAASIVTRFISLTDPAQRQAYINGLKETIAAAKYLGCKTIVSQVGQEIPGVPRAAQHRSIVEGLKACVPILEEADIMLVIEPLNTYVDHPGYYLYSSKEGFEIVAEVGSPYVKVLYDVYHMQVMEGNIISTIESNTEYIGFYEIAGVPGRHEPYTGELYYIHILQAIERTGYDGYIGLEYFPAENPSLGLAKFRKWVKDAGLLKQNRKSRHASFPPKKTRQRRHRVAASFSLYSIIKL